MHANLPPALGALSLAFLLSATRSSQLRQWGAQLASLAAC
jgi:hypothetical protein